MKELIQRVCAFLWAIADEPGLEDRKRKEADKLANELADNAQDILKGKDNGIQD